MQLFRSELQFGFEKKCTLIPIKSLDVPNLKFGKPDIHCELSCKQENQGFKLTGNLSCNLLMNCDRCLTEFQNNQDILIKLILTSRNDLLSEENDEIILFPEEMKEIDITHFIRDSIQLSNPIKTVCKISCKGLCSICGINLNMKSCNCTSRQKYTPFDKLDHLISN